jgi:hypothetical protein
MSARRIDIAGRILFANNQLRLQAVTRVCGPGASLSLQELADGAGKLLAYIRDGRRAELNENKTLL